MGQMLYICRFTTQGESILRIDVNLVGLVGFVNCLLLSQGFVPRRRDVRFVVSEALLRIAPLLKDKPGRRKDATLLHFQICIFRHYEAKLFKFGALTVDVLGDPMADCAVAIILET